MSTLQIPSKFPLGQIVMTRGVSDKMEFDVPFAVYVFDSLKRHANKDWGDICEEDIKENELSLREGFRLLSSYHADGDKFTHSSSLKDKIWIITERNRLLTTILFPEEY